MDLLSCAAGFSGEQCSDSDSNVSASNMPAVTTTTAAAGGSAATTTTASSAAGTTSSATTQSENQTGTCTWQNCVSTRLH